MKVKAILLILAVLMTASLAWAETYHFVTLEFPPLEYAGPDGQAQGIAVEIVRKVMTHLGHEVNVSVLPWARALEMTRSGGADAIFTAYKNPEREKFLDYSKGVLAPQIVALYVPRDSAIAYDGDLMKLKDMRIGVVSTISYGKKFDGLRDKLKVDRAESLESSLKKLLAGRVDVVISNVYVADSEIKKLGLGDQLKRLSPHVQSVDSFIAFSKAKGLSTLRDSFDQELGKLIQDGSYDNIMAKYGVSTK